MNPLGLDAAAKERRRNYLTASDAKRVLEGDWPTLWREKKGLAEGENLDGKLAVQMGSFTEPFNLFWCERQTGRRVEYYSDNGVAADAWNRLTARSARPEFVVCGAIPFMGCSLDALSTTSHGHPCVLDAKHVGQYRYDELVERYTPAGTHQAIVCDVEWWALSVFVGNARWELVEQEVDPFYREAYIAKAREFWSWIERDEEPPDMSAPIAPPKPQPRLRNLDASAEFGTPEWQALVARNNWLADCANEVLAFAETEGAFKAHQAAREGIKRLLPDDIGLFTRQTKRGLFTAKRSSAGVLTMTITEKADG